MLAIGIADAEAMVAEVCVQLDASITADCVPILATSWRGCAAPAGKALEPDVIIVTHMLLPWMGKFTIGLSVSGNASTRKGCSAAGCLQGLPVFHL